jgi:hypothetical protein
MTLHCAGVPHACCMCCDAHASTLVCWPRGLDARVCAQQCLARMHPFNLTSAFLMFLVSVRAQPHSCSCSSADIVSATGAQATNPTDPDNFSILTVNYYPKTEGTEWKADTNRISPHTDETLITLLFTSPGALWAPTLTPVHRRILCCRYGFICMAGNPIHLGCIMEMRQAAWHRWQTACF